MNRIVEHNKNKNGFTLAEVMIVVAIIGILVGISIPVFSGVYKNYQIKQIASQEMAAKAAAVAAFYAGFDSKGNEVKISDTGLCTFLYDEANGNVYVLNYGAGPQDFVNSGYDKQIVGYGITVDGEVDHSDEVILVTFDGRYCRYLEKDIKDSYDDDSVKNKLNMSKGTLEEPYLQVNWESAGTLLYKVES